MCCCNPSSLLKRYFSQLLNFPLSSETLSWWILSFPILNVCILTLSERSIVFLNAAYVFSFWSVSLRSRLLKYSKFTWQWSKPLAISIDSIFENSAHSAPRRVMGNWKLLVLLLLHSSDLSLGAQTHLNTIVLLDILQVLHSLHASFISSSFGTIPNG